VPITSTDLLCFASANMPDSDSGTNGGAIDLDRRVDFTQLAANDDLEVVSSSSSDTQNCTIEARNAAGQVVSETKALTGTSAAVFSNLGVVERVLKVELASDAVGTVTVRRSVGGATVRTIPVGERGFMALFRKCASDPAAQKDYFTKVFLKNNHGTLSLLGAQVKQSADPEARITHLLANAVNDSATATNRVTAPAAGDTQDPDTFDDTDKSVPGTDLAAGAAIGVWLRLRLPAADPPHRSTYDLEITGQSV
jgi:hypothetical protein